MEHGDMVLLSGKNDEVDGGKVRILQLGVLLLGGGTVHQR